MTTFLDSKDKIREAAIHELKNKGILGLRLADVAREAGVSQTLIHKQFRDRDGLIADVLGEIIRSMFSDSLKLIREYVASRDGNFALGDLVAFFADVENSTYRENRWMRIRIFAAASEIPALWTSLQASQEFYISEIENLAREVRGRDGLNTPFDSRPFAIGLASMLLGLVFNDMTGNQMTNEQFKRLITTYLESHHF